MVPKIVHKWHFKNLYMFVSLGLTVNNGPGIVALFLTFVVIPLELGCVQG